MKFEFSKEARAQHDAAVAKEEANADARSAINAEVSKLIALPVALMTQEQRKRIAEIQELRQDLDVELIRIHGEIIEIKSGIMSDEAAREQTRAAEEVPIVYQSVAEKLESIGFTRPGDASNPRRGDWWSVMILNHPLYRDAVDYAQNAGVRVDHLAAEVRRRKEVVEELTQRLERSRDAKLSLAN